MEGETKKRRGGERDRAGCIWGLAKKGGRD